MSKTEVYSWRVDPAVKAALEEEARERRQSVAAVLDVIVDEWLARRANEEERDEQARLHAELQELVGIFEGDDPDRAASVREQVRRRLERRRAGA